MVKDINHTSAVDIARRAGMAAKKYRQTKEETDKVKGKGATEIKELIKLSSFSIAV